MKYIVVILLLLTLCTGRVKAQILRDLDKRVERKVNDRINRKVDQVIDKGLDQTENTASGKNKTKTRENNNNQPNKESRDKGNDTKPGQSFGATSKFDFVQGDKIVAMEDFAAEAVGDFPSRWDTDASGEVMTLDGEEGKWFAFTRSGAVTPEFINSLPDNFTLEFDLVVSPNYSYYDGALGIAVAQIKNKREFNAWKLYGDSRRAGQSGVMLWLHPQQAGAQVAGHSQVELWENGKKVTGNKLENITSFNRKNNKVHVAIWRQNQRLRVYLGEEKIWDLPRAFTAGSKFNTLVLSRYDAKDDHNFFISNIRLAAGQPDIRHKLLEEGKFSTSGICFNSGSATIKASSHGVLKEIAGLLKEQSSMSILVTGHTDNVGNDAANLKLSEQRAASVKQYLHQVFGIDKSRMNTSGKGAAQPLANNNTAEGRAQNRRVEFVKAN